MVQREASSLSRAGRGQGRGSKLYKLAPRSNAAQVAKLRPSPSLSLPGRGGWFLVLQKRPELDPEVPTRPPAEVAVRVMRLGYGKPARDERLEVIERKDKCRRPLAEDR